MAIPQTMTNHRNRVRYFALIWAGITLLVGAFTFIAVYATTGVAVSRGIAPVGIQPPVDSSNNSPIVLQITATPIPTLPVLIVTNPPANGSTTDASTPTLVGTQATGPVINIQPVTPVAAGPTPTLSAIKDLDFDLGIAVQENPDPGVYKNWVNYAGSQLKLNWVKSQIVWRDVEKVKGKIDWAYMDTSLPQLSKANIKVLLSIVKAPDWARDKGANITQPGQHDGPPANPQDMADFITAVLTRYPGMVQAIEIFNEINLDREWTTAPQTLDAARYVKLLQVTHDAIKAADPNIIVVSAALSPTGATSDGAYQDDFAYFDRLVAAGVLKYADCVGAHHNGYNVPPTALYNNIPERVPPAKYFRGPWDNPNHSWSFRSTLEGYEKKIKAAGFNTKLCVTEFGWPSTEGLKGTARAGFEFAKDNTLADQANFIDGAITYMQQSGNVRLAFLFNLNYGAQAGWSLNGAVGDNVLYAILGPNYQPRPVWQKIVDRNFQGQVRKASAQ